MSRSTLVSRLWASCNQARSCAADGGLCARTAAGLQASSQSEGLSTSGRISHMEPSTSILPLFRNVGKAWLGLAAASQLHQYRLAATVAAHPTAGAAKPEAQPSVRRRSPAARLQTGAFAVKISVTGFEQRYVDMACSTISDLLLLAFAPKSYQALPVGSPKPDHLPVNLSLHVQRKDVHVPWHRTRFTLIRGPHIDKKGMEQFERREYKTILSAATNSSEEVQRMLEALKIYQFPGVQLHLDVSSALAVPLQLTNTLPPATSQQEPDGYVAIPQPKSSEQQMAEELDRALRVLQPAIYQGLVARRNALAGIADYQAWLARQRAVPTPVPGLEGPGQRTASDSAFLLDLGAYAAGAATPAMQQALLAGLTQQRLQQLQRKAAEAPPGGSGSDSSSSPLPAGSADVQQTARLLAKIDMELLTAHSTALQQLAAPAGSRTADVTGAGAPAGAWPGPPPIDRSRMTPEQYKQAVLQYVRYVDKLEELAGAKEHQTKADMNLQVLAPRLALRLLQLWWQATSTAFKQHLALPPLELEKAMRTPKQQQAQEGAAVAQQQQTGAGGQTGGGQRAAR